MLGGRIAARLAATVGGAGLGLGLIVIGPQAAQAQTPTQQQAQQADAPGAPMGFDETGNNVAF